MNYIPRPGLCSVPKIAANAGVPRLPRTLVVTGLLLFCQLAASARTFYVTSTADSTNQNSLRGAIRAAAAAGGNNTVVVPYGNYSLTVTEPLADGSLSRTLVIATGNLVIRGNGNPTIHISGPPGWTDESVFRVMHGARVTLENLLITGGHSTKGGGIYNDGTLSVTGCVIAGNEAAVGWSGMGGGVFNSGRITLRDCVIIANATSAGVEGSYLGGGGLSGDVTIGYPGGDGGDGAGIYNDGQMEISNSTITQNKCGRGGNGSDGLNAPGGHGGRGGHGGGIYNTGRLVARNCVFSGNAAGAGGNGASSQYSEGPPHDGNGGDGGSGGGIFNAGYQLDVVINNTSLVANSAGSAGPGGATAWPGKPGSGPSIFGPFTRH